MMPDTAWIELVETGWNVLVDADRVKIVAATKGEDHCQKIPAGEIYGDGQAGEKIAGILKGILSRL